MTVSHYWSRFFIALLLLISLDLQAEEACLKLVFNQYCLGGEITRLQQLNPSFVHQQSEGDRFALIYAEGRERIYVMAYKGRIYKVLRQFKPATRVKFTELKKLLSGKYGLAEQFSQFPDYAKGLASQIGSIRRGEGKAELHWLPKQQAWGVTLSWTREMGLTMFYTAIQLDGKQHQLMDDRNSDFTTKYTKGTKIIN